MNVMEEIFNSGSFVPSYFDVKFLKDQAEEWRARCKKSAASIRRNRANMCASRDLYERIQLKYQVTYHEKAFATFWSVYKAAHHNSVLVEADYNIGQRGGEVCR